MKNITKKQTEIMNAHIEAKKMGNFTSTPMTSLDNMRQQLLEGKTSKALLEEVEIRYCPITAIILSSTFTHESKSYLAGLRKGFKLVLSNLKIE